MKQYVYPLLLALPMAATAQPTLQVAQDYNIGTVIKYKKVIPVSPGANGANITWNFTGLTALGGQDTLTISYLAPGTAYLGANVLEHSSDSQYHYFAKNAAGNYTVAFADSSSGGQNLTMSFITNTALAAQRPLTYGLNVTDTFSGNLFYMGLTIPTSGFNTRNVNVTGYGTLSLPTATFNDVLKVRTEHKQTNAIAVPAPYLVNITMVSYWWFDAQHKAPLLRIDSFIVNGNPAPPVPNIARSSVSYMVKETYPQNVNNVYGSNINFSAFLKDEVLTLQGTFAAGKEHRVTLTNMSGQTIYTSGFTTRSLYSFNIGHSLPAGMYLVTVQEKDNVAHTGTIRIIR